MRFFFQSLIALFGACLLSIAAVLQTPRQQPAASSSLIAFVSFRNGQWDLYQMLPDGSQVRPLTNSPEAEIYPEWSPTLPILAYGAPDQSGGTILYLVHARGSLPVPVAHSVSGDRPRWSPNGAWLLYTANEDGDTDVFRIRPDGTDQQKLTDNTRPDAAPYWSPDGRQIVYRSSQSTHDDLWRMDINGKNPRHLTASASYATYPLWTPDGQWIVFGGAGEWDIFRVNPDGYQIQNLTGNPAFDDDLAPSPDGQWLAFTSDRDGNRNIYRMKVDGSHLERLTDDPDADRDPRWSPDGQWILFVSARDGGWEIYKMRADGSDEQRLTFHSSDDVQPAWSAPMEKPWQARRLLLLGLCLLLLAGITALVFRSAKNAARPADDDASPPQDAALPDPQHTAR